MDTSGRAVMRLLIVSAAAAGVALTSPIAAIADQAGDVETSPPGEATVQTLPEEAATEPLVIELVVEAAPDNDPADTTSAPVEVPADDPEEEQPAATVDGDAEPIVGGDEPKPEPVQHSSDQDDETAAPTASEDGESESAGELVAPVVASMEATPVEGGHVDDAGGEHPGGPDGQHPDGEHPDGQHPDGEHPDGEHPDGEHPGGSRGTGNPYRMMFVVEWRLADGSTIPVLDGTLPSNWRTIFELAAASATGSGKPTAARCTYPEGSSNLVCEFLNPGHHSPADGMIVPAKRTATYSVTVPWPTEGWSIDGANAGPYSARELCPRSDHDHGDDHGGDHGDDHGDDHGGSHVATALESEGFPCVHTVVMRQLAIEVDPPQTEPPVVEVPAENPPVSETPTPAPAPPVEEPPAPVIEVQPATVTPKQLPATGTTESTMLLIGAIALSLGSGLLMISRRRTSVVED